MKNQNNSVVRNGYVKGGPFLTEQYLDRVVDYLVRAMECEIKAIYAKESKERNRYTRKNILLAKGVATNVYRIMY